MDRDRHTGRVLCEDKSIDQGDASASQRMPKIVSKPLEAWKSMEQILTHSVQKEPTLQTLPASGTVR